MARLRNLWVGAINVVFHERTRHNDAQEYLALIRMVFDRQHPVFLGGNRRMLMGLLQRGDSHLTLTGTLDRYIEIEPTGWWNLQKRVPASPEEIRSIRIPPNLGANHRSFPYFFDAEKHRFAFLVRDSSLQLSPNDVQRFLVEIVHDDKVLERFGDISVHLEQAPGKLDAILNAPHLKRLVIEVERPNDDSIGSLENLFSKRLGDQGAKKAMVALDADKDQSLKPARQIRRLAEVALSNGEVYGKIVEDGAVKDVTSKRSPRLEHFAYSLKKLSPVAAFQRTARKLLSRFLSGKSR